MNDLATLAAALPLDHDALTLAVPALPPAAIAPAAPVVPVALRPLLAAALDEVDVGIALLDAQGGVLHLNHRARQWLEGGAFPLQVLGGRLRTREPVLLARLHEALRDAAQRGLRRLLALDGYAAPGPPAGPDEHPAPGPARRVALVPLHPGVVALIIGRTRPCEDLSLQCFAREHALTAAETRVLAALCSGRAPAEVAREQGVKLSTVRTQIGALRLKTGAPSITALVRLVATLPPMVSALRQRA